MTGRMQFEYNFSQPGKSRRGEGSAQRILILGDFSGHRPDQPDISARKPVWVDIDNTDAVLRRLAPQLRISLDAGNNETLIEFRELEDFHPDALYQRLPVFNALRKLRTGLENPATYAATAEELKNTIKLAPTTAAEEELKPTPTATEEANDFARLLGSKPPSAIPAPNPRPDPIQDLIRGLVEPHLVRGVDLSQQPQFMSALDDAISQTMRSILHDPAFQALEAAWRGLEWLVGNVEDSEALRIYLLDASRDELVQDLLSSAQLGKATAIFRCLTETSLAIPGGEPWSIVVGNYTFGEDAESLRLLESLGAISANCGGYFLAGASPKLLGCESLAATPDAADWTPPPAETAQPWNALRHSKLAQHIALALPRFMLRLPYGKQSNPTESFRFEELPPRPTHEHYLWGNSGLICACTVARGWQESDGEEPGSLQYTGRLPYHVFDDGTGQAIKPCTEVYLNEKTANAILGSGIIPVLSVRNQDRAIIPRLVSIADPATEVS